MWKARHTNILINRFRILSEILEKLLNPWTPSVSIARCKFQKCHSPRALFWRTDMFCAVNDVLDNGALPSILYGSFDQCLDLVDSFLPEHVQNIVGNQRQPKCRLIGIEFFWRELFNAYSCFAFIRGLKTSVRPARRYVLSFHRRYGCKCFCFQT